jgi:O-antigen ligase
VASSPSKGQSDPRPGSKEARKAAAKAKQDGRVPQPASKPGAKAPVKPGKPASVGSGAKPSAGMSGAQKVVWVALHLLVLLVPIAMSNFNWMANLFPGSTAFTLPLTYDQFDIVKVFVMRACVLIALGAWAFEFFFKGGTWRRTKLDVWIAGFLAWVLLTSLTSISPATAIFGKYRRFEGFFSFLTYAAVFFLVVQLADRPGRIRSLARTLMLASVIVAGYGVLQSIGLDPIRWGANLPFEANRAFSTFGNPDLLGGFIIFPLTIGMAMALSEKKVGWRIFYWATFLISVWAWIAAAVRGAWIGGAVGIVIVIVAAVVAGVKLGVVDWSFAGLTGLAAGGLVVRSLSMPGTVFNVPERLASIFKFGEGSALTRFEIWQAAWDAVKARPIFGFGADTFRLVFPKYKPLAYVKDAGYLSVADNVHDYPLQLMAGIGIIGFLLLYGIFGFALWLGFTNAFAKGKGPDRLVIAGFWAAAVGYITHLMTGLSVTGSSVFLWLAIAIIVAPTATEREFRAPSWGPLVGMGLITVFAIASIGNVVFFSADNYFLRGQFPATGEDPIALTKTAIALNPYNDIYRSMLGKAYESQMLGWLQQAQKDQTDKKDPAASVKQAQLSFQQAEQTFKETIAIVPTEYDNYLFISSLYNEAGTYMDPKYLTQAVAWADKGIEVEPFGPGVRLQKAVAQAASGDNAGALATIEAQVGPGIAVYQMDPRYADIHLFYAQTLQRAGRLQDAVAQYKYLVGLDPTNTGYADGLKAVEASLGAGAASIPTPPGP